MKVGLVIYYIGLTYKNINAFYRRIQFTLTIILMINLGLNNNHEYTIQLHTSQTSG